MTVSGPFGGPPTGRDLRSLLINIAAWAVVAVAAIVVDSVALSIVILSLGLAIALAVLLVVARSRRAIAADQERLSGELHRARERIAEVEALSSWGEVTACTGLTSFSKALEISEMHPHEALPNIARSLDFMGNGASKWSKQEKEMREMLERVRDESGRVRMLILNPYSEILKDKPAERSKIITSLKLLDAFRSHKAPLEIRTYDHQPNFRIALIDGELAAIGHYRNYREDSKKSPLLLFRATSREREHPWSFYSPFKLLFEHEWNASSDVDWDRIRRHDA